MARPKHKITIPPEAAHSAPEAATAKRRRVKFTDRKQVETYCAKSLTDITADFDVCKSQIGLVIKSLQRTLEVQSEAGTVDLSLVRLLESQQQRFRQVLNDKARLLSTLMKQFELLTALSPEAKDDPRYTPVTFVLAAVPPPSAIKEAAFRVAPEDVQPEEAAL